MNTSNKTNLFDYENDANKIFETLKNGGVSINPILSGYAIMGASDESITKIYTAKQRPLDKPSGIVSNFRTHNEIHMINSEHKQIIKDFSENYEFPLAVLAPFDNSHPLFQNLTPFMRSIGTKNSTVNFLINSGPLRSHIANLSMDNEFPMIASSANVSGSGVKYKVEDIEPELLSVADVVIDYGEVPYQKFDSSGFPLSSTIIDFQSMKVMRQGVFFDELVAVFSEQYNLKFDTD